MAQIKYVVSVRGQIPADICERISSAHATFLQSNARSAEMSGEQPEATSELTDIEQQAHSA